MRASREGFPARSYYPGRGTFHCEVPGPTSQASSRCAGPCSARRRCGGCARRRGFTEPTHTKSPNSSALALEFSSVWTSTRASSASRSPTRTVAVGPDSSDRSGAGRRTSTSSFGGSTATPRFWRSPAKLARAGRSPWVTKGLIVCLRLPNGETVGTWYLYCHPDPLRALVQVSASSGQLPRSVQGHDRRLARFIRGPQEEKRKGGTLVPPCVQQLVPAQFVCMPSGQA